MIDAIMGVKKWINDFMIDRANEALSVELFLHYSTWAWFGVGLIVISLFIACLRIYQLLPEENAMALSGLRSLSKLIAYSLIIFVLTVFMYLFFAFIGGPNTWSIYVVVRFWPFVFEYGRWTMYGATTGLIVGWWLWILIARKMEPRVANWLHSRTLKVEREGTLTDARSVADHLPHGNFKIDHFDFFKKAKERNSMVMGVTEDNKAVLIPRPEWVTSHVQVVGPPGAGKGVLMSAVMAQAITNFDDAVVYIDPKDDEWAPHVMAQACEQTGKPFIYIDLRSPTPQINPIEGINLRDMTELLIAGFGLGRQGGDSDHYRNFDRKAARQLARLVVDGDTSLPEMFDNARDVVDADILEKATGLLMQLEEVASITSIQTRHGLDLAHSIKNGGVVYIVASLRDEAILILIKIIITRLFQVIEKRADRDRHVTCCMDEVKFLLSMPVLSAMSTIRDKNCNLILTHQTLGDLRACGADIDADAVLETIKNTTPIKWIYRSKDPETVAWATAMSGRILVDKERREIQRNELLVETAVGERTVDQVERNLIDENMIMHMPNGCALSISSGIAKLAFASPIPTTKRTLAVTPAAPIKRTQPGDSLITKHSDNSEPEKIQEPGDDLI